MSGASVTFFISFAGIIAMFGVKLLEMKTGRQSLMSRVSERTNHLVHREIARVRYIAAHFTKRNAILLGKFVVYHALLLAHRIYHRLRVSLKAYLERKPKHPINMVLGKEVLKKKGSVSFFLKNIAEEAKKREVIQ